MRPPLGGQGHPGRRPGRGPGNEGGAQTPLRAPNVSSRGLHCTETSRIRYVTDGNRAEADGAGIGRPLP